MSTSPSATCTALLVQDGGKDLTLGGAEHSLVSLARELPKIGWTVHVAVSESLVLIDHLAAASVPHSILPVDPALYDKHVATLRLYWRWYRFLRRLRPAIIHANNFSLSRCFSFAAAALRIPFVNHVRLQFPESEVQWVFEHQPSTSGIIFNSHFMQEHSQPGMTRFCPRAPQFVVHNGVDLSRFCRVPEPEAPPFVVTMIANFAPFKNHMTFLQMARAIVQAGGKVEFWLVGTDIAGMSERSRIESLVKAEGLVRHFRFLGARTDVPELLARTHMLVHTARGEPFGRVIVEAMACGRPVVASADGGIPEIVVDGETGFLVRGDDPRTFAERALQLMADPALRHRMGLAGAERARAEFSQESHARKIARVYGRVASCGHRSGFA